MGWWGTGVMEGDEPQDIVCMIQDAVDAEVGVSDEMRDKLEELEDTNHPDAASTREDLEELICKAMQDPAAVNRVLKAVDEETDEPGWNWGVVAMAVAHEIITRGWYLPDAERRAAIKASRYGSVAGWKNPDARRKALKAFANAVERYKGKPIQIETRGLMQMVFGGHREEYIWREHNFKKSRKQLRNQRRRNKPWSN